MLLQPQPQVLWIAADHMSIITLLLTCSPQGVIAGWCAEAVDQQFKLGRSALTREPGDP